MKRRRLIDLSVTIRHAPGAFNPCEITYRTHQETAKFRGRALGVPESFFPDSMFAASEIITLSTHVGTHLDAPWHYAPTSEGKPAKTIDQIPLEWCYGDGVLLDFTHKRAGELISVDDVKQALDNINYRLKPFDIVLIRTDASKHFGEETYERIHPGMGRESTLWLIEQGIKVMGIDAWGWDRPLDVLLHESKSGKNVFWAAHFLGKEREYCHLENLANLHLIPVPYSFTVAVFPVKINRVGAGWVRAVAIITE